MCLMLAVVLLQSIGLLSPRPDQRTLSKMYHEVLVMVGFYLLPLAHRSLQN